MPYDFNLDLNDQEEQVSDQEMNQILGRQEAPGPQNAAPDVDRMFNEAERRLRRAQYYQSILNEELFQDDGSQDAIDVREEIREFARNRLAILLGVKTEQTAAKSAIFDDQEVKVLKQIVAKLLKKPELAEPAKPPSLKPVNGPKTRPAPALTKKTEPQETKQRPVSPTAPARGSKPTGAFIELDGIKYTEFQDNRGSFYRGPDGRKYIVATNEAGQKFMKSVMTQSRPNPDSVVKPIPRLDSDTMAVVASRHAKAAMAQVDKSVAVVASTLNEG